MKVLAPFLIEAGVPKMDVNFACDMDEMIDLAIGYNLVHPDDVQQLPKKVPALPSNYRKVRVRVTAENQKLCRMRVSAITPKHWLLQATPVKASTPPAKKTPPKRSPSREPARPLPEGVVPTCVKKHTMTREALGADEQAECDKCKKDEIEGEVWECGECDYSMCDYCAYEQHEAAVQKAAKKAEIAAKKAAKQAAKAAPAEAQVVEVQPPPERKKNPANAKKAPKCARDHVMKKETADGDECDCCGKEDFSGAAWLCGRKGCEYLMCAECAINQHEENDRREEVIVVIQANPKKAPKCGQCHLMSREALDPLAIDDDVECDCCGKEKVKRWIWQCGPCEDYTICDVCAVKQFEEREV